jgi:type II secretory pathway pseudopilin PulG
MIEILVVMAVIGFLAGLSIFIFQSIRLKASATQDLSAVVQIQKALELYHFDHNVYPSDSEVRSGQALTNSSKTLTYLAKIPSLQVSADCPDGAIHYRLGYQGQTYNLSYCLSQAAQDYRAGNCVAMPNLLCLQSTCSCVNSLNNCCGWCAVGDQCGGGQLIVKNYNRLSSGLTDLVAMPSGCVSNQTLNPICDEADRLSPLTWSTNPGVDEPADDPNDGRLNTDQLLADDRVANPIANYCQSLVINSFDDWYLPSQSELSQSYSQNNTIGFQANLYWSSNEYDDGYYHQAKLIDFNNGMTKTEPKTSDNYYFRCLRHAF